MVEGLSERVLGSTRLRIGFDIFFMSVYEVYEASFVGVHQLVLILGWENSLRAMKTHIRTDCRDAVA